MQLLMEQFALVKQFCACLSEVLRIRGLALYTTAFLRTDSLRHRGIFLGHYFHSSLPHPHHFEFELNFLPLFLGEKIHTQENGSDVSKRTENCSSAFS